MVNRFHIGDRVIVHWTGHPPEAGTVSSVWPGFAIANSSPMARVIINNVSHIIFENIIEKIDESTFVFLSMGQDSRPTTS